MFTFTQDVLKQILNLKLTALERMSEHERQIAARICHCTCCDYLWVRKFATLPNRCPRCHKRDWDRPLITAILAAEQARTTKTQSQEEQKTKGPNP